MTFIILLLALVLRLVLFNQSLWLDESLEALALMGKMGPIMQYALYDFQPPLYHLILLGWTKIAGYSEIALRIPSLLSGLGIVWFTIKIGELLVGKKVGRIAGLLAATNPLLIYYSQEGRTYAMTAFLVTASFYYLLILLQSKKSNSLHTLYFILYTTLSLWTSYIAWIVVGLQALYLLYRRNYRLFTLTILASLTLLLWLPSLIRSLGIGLTTAGTSPEWSRIVGGISLKALALTWVKINLGRISFDNKYIYGLVVVVLLILHSSVLRKVKKMNPLLLIWLAGPVTLTGLLSLFIPVYSYFRLLFIIPAYLLFLALGLSHSSRYYSYFTLTLQLLFLSFFWVSPRFHREDWRSLTNYLNRASAGAVGMPSLNQSAPLTYYQLNKPLFEPKLSVSNNASNIYYIRYVEDLFDVGRLGPANLASAGYRLVRQQNFAGLELLEYTREDQ